MKKFILIIGIAFSSVLLANAQRKIAVYTPAKKIIVHHRPILVKPVASVVAVKPAPVVVVKPVFRRRVVVVHH
ncbi:MULTISPECIES: hypothetical protein [unclassified Pedobacter]|uniref:hypothetical protein n=1 Tax=unclassified Pedobacter TaxID=2628915 RepID=UPI0014202D15|nr:MULTISPECIES: hypothetical protein [unclassified Pedobacter]NII83741.1 hypothetical protein [Pedobacter sp. SG908]NMN37598.1 hypothetical protein [Pedobacter sp. SG918]